MNDWSISNPPPEGHQDVGPFFAKLVADGDTERIRLGLEDRWKYNHRMVRGDHWNQGLGVRKGEVKKLTMNMLFANIERTVANLTAKQPVVEAVETGQEVETGRSDKMLTAWLKKWWIDTDQNDSMVDSVNQMEINGPTIEKYFFNGSVPDTAVLDVFAFGKSPGVFDDLQSNPYLYHKSVMRVDEVERRYGQKKGLIVADDAYSIMAEDREEHSPRPSTRNLGPSGSVSSMNGSVVNRGAEEKNRYGVARAVLNEVWIKDYSNAEKYPDNIRVVTYTNEGKVVLKDRNNPNINWPAFRDPATQEGIANTYLFGRYPFRMKVSYRDKTSDWGFSALEQTADINEVIDEIVSRLYAYVSKSLLPVLIVPKDTGITPRQINNKAGLLLQPSSSAQAGAIRYMDAPRVSLDVYKFLDVLRSFFDQIWHIEDADRGERPSGLIAAQAIQALQERNAVLMRAKIRSVDSLVEGRGKAAISMLQNFGLKKMSVKVDSDFASFVGTDLLGQNFEYVVESGSTVQKTTTQIQAQAVDLYREGAIDKQALLETMDFPNWKSIIERTSENELDQAFQILIGAGMEKEMAAELKTFLLEPNQNQETANASV